MPEKLKLRESIYILQEKEDVYNIIFTSTRRVRRFQIDSLVKDVIDRLNEGDIGEEELVGGLAKKYSPTQIQNCVFALEHQGVISRYSRECPERHKNQILFMGELTNSEEEAMGLQERLGNSKIAVFGTGGIGTWVVNGLYQIGIGEIRISDPDTVEESNFNRQLFFDSSDIGKYKVDVLKRKLQDANIVSFKKEVSKEEDLEEIVSGTDFLVNCADSPSVSETTQILDEYARKHNIPYCVAGGYNMHLGMVGPIIVPGVTATFEDFLRYQKSMDPLKDMKKIKDISKTGNLGPIAGAVANMQVMEIFKYLIGKGTQNLNRFAEIDFMDLSVNWREFH